MSNIKSGMLYRASISHYTPATEYFGVKHGDTILILRAHEKRYYLAGSGKITMMVLDFLQHGVMRHVTMEATSFYLIFEPVS